MAAATPSSGLVPKRTQAACCYTSAMEADATYCGECGKPLIRCMAFEECGGLLDDAGLCTVCVAPHLEIDAGALTAAQVGAAVALPVSIANLSAVGRPLFVTRLLSREGSGEWREESLGWERLEAGESRPAMITADKMDRAGAHGIQILVAVASRWRWRQECHVFTARLTLSIEDDRGKTGPVVNIGGEQAGHGNVVHISGQAGSERAKATSDEALSLAMVRVEKEERRLGLRGITESLWVPRRSLISWRGFGEREVPMDSPILTPDGLLSAGRIRARADGGQGDIRLLAETPEGTVDEDLSRLLSRRHFELYIECDRLVLRVTGTGGLRVNGEAYGPGKSVVLNNGDVIAPIVKAADTFQLRTDFQTEHGRVVVVTFTRTPPSQRGG